MSPCCGLNGPGRALLALGILWTSTGDYDINIALHTVMEQLSPGHAFCGKHAGDLTKVPLESLDLETELLIAGPPCPPFSTIGKGLGELDPRSHIFLTVMQWIIYLATKGQLCMFILENVVGIAKRQLGAPPFLAWVEAELQSALPAGWLVVVKRANALNASLPQNRERVFITGYTPRMIATEFQKRIVQQPLPSLPPVDITIIVEKTACPSDWNCATLKQKMNVTVQQEKFEEARSLDHSLSEIAVTDCSRDPDGQVDSQLSIGHFRTLRTNCSDLWLLPGTSYWKSVIGPHGRRATRAEKAWASGFDPSCLASLSNAEFEKAIGSTIPVPLAGVILIPMLRAWMHSHRSVSLESSSSTDSLTAETL